MLKYIFRTVLLVEGKPECVWHGEETLLFLPLEWDKVTQKKQKGTTSSAPSIAIGRRAGEWEAWRKMLPHCRKTASVLLFFWPFCKIWVTLTWCCWSLSLSPKPGYILSPTGILEGTGTCLRLPGGQQGAEWSRSKSELPCGGDSWPPVQEQKQDLGSIIN